MSRFSALAGIRLTNSDLRAVLNAIFYLLRTGCQWRLLPREFPCPGTVYHYFRAWKDAGVLAELQRALHEQARLKPRPLALPFGGHPGQSVGQDHRARRHPWFRWAQTGQRAQTPPARGHPGDCGGPSGRSRQCVGCGIWYNAKMSHYSQFSRSIFRLRFLPHDLLGRGSADTGHGAT